MVDDLEVNLNEMLKIKRITSNVLFRQARQMGLSMYIRDLQNRPLVNTTALLTSGLFANLNFTVFDKWYGHADGWEFRVEELG